MFQRVGRANLNAETAQTAEVMVYFKIGQNSFVIGVPFRLQTHASRRTDLNAGITGNTEVVACFFIPDKTDRAFETRRGESFLGILQRHPWLEGVADRHADAGDQAPDAFKEISNKTKKHYRLPL